MIQYKKTPSHRRDLTMIYLFIILAIFILFQINKLTNTLCLQKEIPEERQPQIFRTINILITILLISSYVEILFT
jgi:hypothetical protein